MGSRRRSREFALQILFESDFNPEGLREALARVTAEQDLNEEVASFLERLIEGYVSYKENLDEKLESLSNNWKMNRMASVDRNLLRLGVLEIAHFEDVPKTVAINEYLEIAKKFGTSDSAGFINGILDKVSKDK